MQLPSKINKLYNKYVTLECTMTGAKYGGIFHSWWTTASSIEYGHYSVIVMEKFNSSHINTKIGELAEFPRPRWEVFYSRELTDAERALYANW